MAQAVGKGEIFLRKVLKLNGANVQETQSFKLPSLTAEFSLEQPQISNILKELRDFVYFNVQYLNRNRNLDDDRYHYY